MFLRKVVLYGKKKDTNWFLNRLCDADLIIILETTKIYYLNFKEIRLVVNELTCLTSLNSA